MLLEVTPETVCVPNFKPTQLLQKDASQIPTADPAGEGEQPPMEVDSASTRGAHITVDQKSNKAGRKRAKGGQEVG